MIEVITPLAKHIARMKDPEKFIREFERRLPSSKTQREAYIKTEAEFYRLFEEPKYSSYKSFERVYYRWKRRQKAEKG